MRRWLSEFYRHLADPIVPWTRLALALAVVPLAFAATQKLWTLHFMAPQYPQGLHLYVYPYTIVGGNDGNDLPEINTLNHYVGMKKLDPDDFTDLDFIPFAMGALALLTLRVAVIGDVRALLDLAVLTGYFGVFALGRFVYMLYNYGHSLDPHAPIRMQAFMPPILGTKQMGNFVVSSWPATGTWLMTGFAAIVMGFAVWHTLRPRRPDRLSAG
jgi:copper chaperone NosL